jgi:hypothetical protein
MTNHNKELREAILKKIKLDNHNNTNDTKHLALNSSTKLQTMQGTMCVFPSELSFLDRKTSEAL